MAGAPSGLQLGLVVLLALLSSVLCSRAVHVGPEQFPQQPQLSRLQDVVQRPLEHQLESLLRREKHQPQRSAASKQRQADEAEEVAQQPSDSPDATVGPPKLVPLGAIALMTLCMALASGLGAVPFFFVGSLSRPWAGLANAVASGVMLAASFGLIQEGSPYSGPLTIAGMLLGALFIKLSQQYLDRYEVESFEELRGAEARKVILFLAVMAAHAVGEGSGVGVSFSGRRGWAQGTSVTLAIGLHNVPEGLAVATVMAAKGASPGRALLWAVLTALPQALVALPAFLFVEAFAALLPLAMGFAAGCMVWIVFGELLPDALEALPADKVATAATFSAGWLCALSLYIASLERPNGTLASPFAGQQLPSLLPLALNLLPTCLIPGIAAGMAANLLPSRPAALGLSAGALVGLGAASVLQLLLWSGQGVLWTLLLVPAGWVAGLALWRQLEAVLETVAADKHKKDDEQAEQGALAATWQQHAAVAADAAHAGMRENGHDASMQSSSLVSASKSHSWEHGPSALLRQQLQQMEASLGMLPTAVHAQLGGSKAVLRLAAAGLLAVAANAVALGMTLAQLAPVQLDEPSHLMLPCVLIGTYLALASVGALVLVVGPNVRKVALFAAALSATGPALALCILLVSGTHSSASPADAAGLAGKAQAFAAGLALCTGAVFQWPVARRWHARRALLGTSLGGFLTACGAMALTVMCTATPYCLRLQES